MREDRCADSKNLLAHKWYSSAGIAPGREENCAQKSRQAPNRTTARGLAAHRAARHCGTDHAGVRGPPLGRLLLEKPLNFFVVFFVAHFAPNFTPNEWSFLRKTRTARTPRTLTRAVGIPTASRSCRKVPPRSAPMWPPKRYFAGQLKKACWICSRRSRAELRDSAANRAGQVFGEFDLATRRP